MGEMNILILASSYPRFPGDGTAPFIQSIAKSLHELGNKVFVVAPYDSEVQPSQDKTVEVIRFKYIYPDRWHIMGHARSLKSDVALRPFTFLLLPLFLLSAFITLMKVTKSHKIEVIHANWVLPNGPVAMLVSMFRKIPYVVSLHGSDIFIARKNPVFGWVAGKVLKRASSITACSAELRDGALQLGADPQKTGLLAWGADATIFTPEKGETLRAELLGEKEILVTALGRLVDKKGFGHLINAWREISQDCPTALLLIGGDGPLRSRLDQMIDQHRLQEHIRLLGRVAWDQVPAFLAASDIFVLPSVKDAHGNVDGLPTVLLEAMSSETAVVASSIGGVELVVQHDQNGLIVAPGDEKDLANKIRFLINHPSQRQRLAAEARRSVLDQFNWRNVGLHLQNLFELAVNELAKK